MAAVYKTLSRSGSRTSEASGSEPRKNKQRVLVLSSRGVTYRHRHLLNDIASMLPHSRKDVKFDSKSRLNELNELAELYNCNNVLFFEARKGKDLYLWLSKVPNGPAVKLHLQNLHTMEELHFTGNCLKGSRPILSFDGAFDRQPHLRLIKELLMHVFGVPQGARKSKPFIDHVMGFSVVDGKVWVRNYQICEEEDPKKSSGLGESVAKPATSRDASTESRRPRQSGDKSELKLVEIGPRFVLTPIVIQEGSFGGPIIYENREFISPNQLRADLRKTSASRHNARAEKTMERRAKKAELGLGSDRGSVRRGQSDKGELDTRSLFA